MQPNKRYKTLHHFVGDEFVIESVTDEEEEQDKSQDSVLTVFSCSGDEQEEQKDEEKKEDDDKLGPNVDDWVDTPEISVE